ncbi:MAG: DUF3489 domain-containing protein [Candidatus Saccharibacteria bacterium]|nr:DUF3489 domain-containing protein [Pseudorhodobacter sp.]
MTAQGSFAIGCSAEVAVDSKLGLVSEAQPIDRDGHTHGDACVSHAEETSISAGDIDGAAAGTKVPAPLPASVPVPAPAPAAVPAGKLGSVLSALATEHGATLAALVTLTGWLPHTTRAALCRLRQRGYSIQLVGDAGSRAYRLDIPAQG